MTHMEELAQELDSIVNKISEEGNKRSKDLSNADKELTDIYHMIEFSNFNAAQGYKAYREIKTALTKRREIKNDLKIINEIRANVPGFDKIREACVISDINVNTQSYTPRVREDLFETPSTESSLEELISSSGIAKVYATMPMKADSKHKHHTFKNLQEALEYTISKNGIGTMGPNTNKKIVKKIIKACLENDRYNGYKWTFSK